MKACNHFLIGALAGLACALPAVSQAADATQDTTPADGTVIAQSSTPAEGSGTGSSTSMGSSTSGTSSSGTSGTSWVPYTRNGYIGIGVGGASYDTPCGVVGTCDQSDFAGRIFTGGMITPYFGLELAYLNMGWAENEGGRARAQGANVSVVLRLPLNGDAVALYAKGGATYGWTHTNWSASGSGRPSGEETGFGPSFGGGIELRISPALAGALEWERHRFKFAGDSEDWVDIATVGLKYRF